MPPDEAGRNGGRGVDCRAIERECDGTALVSGAGTLTPERPTEKEQTLRRKRLTTLTAAVGAPRFCRQLRRPGVSRRGDPEDHDDVVDLGEPDPTADDHHDDTAGGDARIPPSSRVASDPLAPPTPLPVSLAVPITALGNEIAGTLLPGQDARTGTHTTAQTSPLADIDTPIDGCSISAGLIAPANSSCSTTAIGTDQLGSIADVNAPITLDDNAIGWLGEAASALGLTTGQDPAMTTQNGAVNVFAPVSICSINVGLAGNTGSDCGLTGTHGVTSQKGVIDAAVPVTVCDVIVEIVGNSKANCPQQPDSTAQSGELADVYAPATVCGVIAEVDGTACTGLHGGPHHRPGAVGSRPAVRPTPP
jgi:hypothetical protein